MKTIKQLSIIFAILSFVLIFYISCESSIALGTKLDIEGPEISITAPEPRKPVSSSFSLEGKAEDYSGVEILHIKVVLNNIELKRQWRYFIDNWYISDNAGESWALYSGGTWTGPVTNGQWSVIINLPDDADDGEYTVIVQAWDKGGFSDDKSYKTRVVIVDRDHPKVNITDPYLYIDYDEDDRRPKDGDFLIFDGFADDDPAMYDPANLGKFTTRGFKLQYQIDDSHDVYSVEIRLYDADMPGLDIDQIPGTELPDGYIFRYEDNSGPPPYDAPPGSNIKPNGTVDVTLSVLVKTTVMVVARCFDSAGNPEQEKILGYFIYWPRADIPWIAFTEGMLTPDECFTEDDVYMVYPGRQIKATSFQAHGVTRTEYRVHRYDFDTKMRGEIVRDTVTLNNPPRFGGIFSTIFPWEFLPPSSTGYYSIVAKAFGVGNVESIEHEVLFYVQDVSFPDFPEQPSPSASLPLFMSIGQPDIFGEPTADNSIRISGIVSDATAVQSVYLVWINPDSKGYAAMSQLAYFRDGDYEGWDTANGLAEGSFGEEGLFDQDNKNKVWNVPITPAVPAQDVLTNRFVYRYSQQINITEHLNMAGDFPKDRPLKSQVFLLRVKNPDGKSTIITYAPQGDEAPPVITIEKVEVKSGEVTVECIPGEYALIEQFEEGDTIKIIGKWYEDSIQALDFERYLKDNFEITLNNHFKVIHDPANGTTLTFTPGAGKGFTQGDWVAEITLRAANNITTENIQDTLVVAAKLKDIGGNISEAGGSWLIRSDTLRLLRISSEMADTKYNTGRTIRIFLEFNKPVEKTNSAAASLQLNVTGAGTITAAYAPGQNIQSTRQFFEYTILASHNTGSDPFLDVMGLVGASGANHWVNAATYPYIWHSGSGVEREEIRLTMEPTHNGDKVGLNDYYTRRLPLYAVPADTVFSLRAGKNIEIDTLAPTVVDITTTNPTGYYSAGSDIFIDVEFSEPVRLTGTPQLTLQLYDASTGASRTVNTNGGVKVNDRKISFSYRVQPGDTTRGNQIVVVNYTGANSIADIAGNFFAAAGISSLTAPVNTLTGRFIESNNPGVPVVKILTSSSNVHGNTETNVITNNVSGAAINGFSTGAGTPNAVGPTPVALSNLYDNELHLAIDGNLTGDHSTPYKVAALEYSVNNGQDWVRAPSIAGNAFVMALPRPGEYRIIARQIDRAGNTSNWSQPVTLNWDPGTLVTRISSASSNGTYTHNTGRNSINITVYFRKPLYFTDAPSLTINAATNIPANAVNITLDAGQTGVARTSLSYTYTVLQGHHINNNYDALLDVTNFTGAFTVRDGNSTTSGVNVNRYITVPPAGDGRLNVSRSIKLDTRPLGISSEPVFTGSVQPDGSWAGTMTMVLNNAVGINLTKGTGSITFEQIAGTSDANRYRLAAVLTEAQYNRFRNVPYINTFYARGTNGYVIRTPVGDSGSDTSTKYVLAYSHDTANITPSAGAAPGTIARFAHEMRMAERIIIPVSAQAVTVSGNTITVNLTGSNALQVPGADYIISYGIGFVQDSLGNRIGAQEFTKPTSGVAKPFIRIRKAQDTIGIQGGSTALPIYTAVQPQTTDARMDSRTPGATIIYRYQSTVTNVTARNWGELNSVGPPLDSLTTGNPNPDILGDPRTTPTGTTTYGGTVITLPIAADNIPDYQGYQWLVRAVARTGPAGSYEYSVNSEEIAYRTVLTYEVNNMSANNGTNLENGQQVWIRGGDAIGSSSVPGFPLTWEDNWDNLSGRRAGIRLLSLTGYYTGGTTLNYGIYKWVSWEINVTTYFDMIKGSNLTNTANDAAVTWQYGPREIAYQRDGWTSYKDLHPMFPGKHRWLFINAAVAFAPKGNTNFSGSWTPRPTYTNTNGWTTPNIANPVPTPVTN